MKDYIKVIFYLAVDYLAASHYREILTIARNVVAGDNIAHILILIVTLALVVAISINSLFTVAENMEAHYVKGQITQGSRVS